MSRFLRQNDRVIDLTAVVAIEMPYMAGDGAANLIYASGQVFLYYMQHRLPPVPECESQTTDWTAYYKRCADDVRQQFDALVDRWCAALAAAGK